MAGSAKDKRVCRGPVANRLAYSRRLAKGVTGPSGAAALCSTRCSAWTTRRMDRVPNERCKTQKRREHWSMCG